MNEENHKETPLKTASETWSISEMCRLFRLKRIYVPDYQRPLVWTPAKKRKLVSSVLEKYHTGLIYLHKLDERNYEIVDGQQRIINLYSYLFPNEANAYEHPKTQKLLKCVDNTPAGVWALKKNKDGFLPWKDLEDDPKAAFENAAISVAILEGSREQAMEQFERLQGGVGLKPGEILHGKLAAPWYPVLAAISDALEGFTRWDKRWLFSGHALAITSTFNPKVKFGLNSIVSALGDSTCEEAQSTVIDLLCYCNVLDKKLLKAGTRYAKWSIETRYGILYNLLSLMEVNKSHLEALHKVLVDHFIKPLEDDKSDLLTKMNGLLLKRRTVVFSSVSYQDLFLPIRTELWKVVPQRDSRRRFSSTDRDVLYKNASGVCEGCKNPLGTEWDAHHIEYWEKGGVTEVANGQALCASCHKETHRVGESGVRYAVDTPKLAAV